MLEKLRTISVMLRSSLVRNYRHGFVRLSTGASPFFARVISKALSGTTLITRYWNDGRDYARSTVGSRAFAVTSEQCRSQTPGLGPAEWLNRPLIPSVCRSVKHSNHIDLFWKGTNSQPTASMRSDSQVDTSRIFVRAGCISGWENVRVFT